MKKQSRQSDFYLCVHDDYIVLITALVWVNCTLEYWIYMFWCGMFAISMYLYRRLFPWVYERTLVCVCVLFSSLSSFSAKIRRISMKNRLEGNQCTFMLLCYNKTRVPTTPLKHSHTHWLIHAHVNNKQLACWRKHRVNLQHTI